MSEGDIGQIITALSNLHTEMKEGFDGVYCKIDKVSDRIKPLEDDKIRRDTLTCQDEKLERRRIDWGKWSIRGLIAFVVLQLAPGLWMMTKRLVSEILGIK